MEEADQYPLVAVEGIPDFWNQVQQARCRFLGLDYDGTLAPFHVQPLQAHPLPGVIETLQQLAAHQTTTEIAIISGRPVAEVLHLIGPLPLTVVGSHGYELRLPGGTCIARKPRPEQKQGLERAGALARAHGYAEKLEYKGASIALHTRGLPVDVARDMQQTLYAEWKTMAPNYDLECRPFNGGIEIRSCGHHKGDALNELLNERPGHCFAVYIGDDETDEDGFRTLRKRQGIGIKVGGGRTAASGFLADCDAVARFLRSWLTVTSD